MKTVGHARNSVGCLSVAVENTTCSVNSENREISSAVSVNRSPGCYAVRIISCIAPL